MPPSNASDKTRAVIIDAPVCTNRQLTGALWELILIAPAVAAAASPGQFVHLALPETSRHILRRPFAVHRVIADADGKPERLSLLYQVTGKGTTSLTTACEGVCLSLLGPMGRGWDPPSEAVSALLVAGGVGWAPLAMLAELMFEHGAEVHVLIGARNAAYLDALINPIEKDLSAKAAFEDFDNSRRLIKHLATDDGSLGYHGMNTELLENLLSTYSFDYIATCGPEPMQRIVAGMALSRGVPCELSLERRMACGIGSCLSCVIQTTEGKKRVCLDGPVFDAREVVW